MPNIPAEAAIAISTGRTEFLNVLEEKIRNDFGSLAGFHIEPYLNLVGVLREMMADQVEMKKIIDEISTIAKDIDQHAQGALKRAERISDTVRKMMDVGR